MAVEAEAKAVEAEVKAEEATLRVALLRAQFEAAARTAAEAEAKAKADAEAKAKVDAEAEARARARAEAEAEARANEEALARAQAVASAKARAEAAALAEAMRLARLEADEQTRLVRERWQPVELWRYAAPAMRIRPTNYPEGSKLRFVAQLMADYQEAKNHGIKRRDFLHDNRNLIGEPLTVGTFRGYQQMWDSHVPVQRKRQVVDAITGIMMERFGNRIALASRKQYIQNVAKCLVTIPDVAALKEYITGNHRDGLTTRRSTLSAIRAAMSVNFFVIPGLEFDFLRRQYAAVSQKLRIMQGNGQLSVREEVGWMTKDELREAIEGLRRIIPAEGDHTYETDCRLQYYVFWRIFYHYPCRLALRTVVPFAATGNRLYFKDSRVVIGLDEYKTRNVTEIEMVDDDAPMVESSDSETDDEALDAVAEATARQFPPPAIFDSVALPTYRAVTAAEAGDPSSTTEPPLAVEALSEGPAEDAVMNERPRW
ncbi:hypothetical protein CAUPRSCDRAFT_11597 [Caulochytrium protostelioides]|nr:hypothetical protein CAUPRSCDRAFT_11597 [Caulochytrium protostelioides]